MATKTPANLWNTKQRARAKKQGSMTKVLAEREIARLLHRQANHLPPDPGFNGQDPALSEIPTRLHHIRTTLAAMGMPTNL